MKHLLRRWYVYATFLTLFMAPLPLIIPVGLTWLVYFGFRLTQSRRKGIIE